VAETIEVAIDLDQSFAKEVDAAADAVDELGDEIDSLRTSGKRISDVTRKVDDVADSFEDAGDEARNAADAAEEMGKVDLSSLSEWAISIKDKIVEIGIEAAKSFATWVAEGTEAERTSANIFTSLTKGEGDFEAFKELAESMGVTVQDLTADFESFANMEGVNLSEAMQLTRLKQDLDATFGEGSAQAQAAMDRVTEAMSKGKSATDAIRDSVRELGPEFEGMGDGSFAAGVAATDLGAKMEQLKSKAQNALVKALEKAQPSIDKLIAAFEELSESGELEAMMSAVASAIVGAAEAGAFLVRNWETVKAIVVGLVPVIGPLKNAWDSASGAIGKVASAIGNAASAIKAQVSQWAGAAGDLVQGFIDGIKAKIADVVSAAGEMATKAVDAVKSKLSISSPSKVFEGLGGNVSEGFAQGVEPVDVADKLVPKIPASNDLAPASPRTGGGAVNITINVDGASGDGQAIASAIRDELDAYFLGQAQAGVA